MSQIVVRNAEHARIRNWAPVRWLREHMGRRPGGSVEDEGDWPPFDPEIFVKETPAGFEVTLDVPGVSNQDLDIRGSGNRLVIDGRRAPPDDPRGEVVLLRESGYGRFSRALVIPNGARAENARAVLDRGVLTVFVPCDAHGAPRTIPINSEHGGKR